MNTIPELLVRAREYVYDRDGLEDFVTDLLESPEEAQVAVADYLAGHGLAIGRFASARKPGPWFWLESSYLIAVKMTLKEQKTPLEVLGRGLIETQDDFGALRF